MKNKFLQGFVFGFALFLGSIGGYLALFAALDWINIPTVTSETPLTSTLRNDTMNTIKGNVQDLDNRISLVDPSGNIEAFAVATCPTGWLETNGASVSTTTYASLFSAIGYMYGGSGGNFNLPDYRGQFLRAWSHGATTDPDKASRINRGDGTTGDNVGTRQGDEFRSHNHSLLRDNPAQGPTADFVYAGYSDTHAGTAGNWRLMAATSTGGNETRPTNVNVLYCIKY